MGECLNLLFNILQWFYYIKFIKSLILNFKFWMFSSKAKNVFFFNFKPNFFSIFIGSSYLKLLNYWWLDYLLKFQFDSFIWGSMFKVILHLEPKYPNTGIIDLEFTCTYRIWYAFSGDLRVYIFWFVLWSMFCHCKSF